MFESTKLEGYRVLDCIGYPNYEINIQGVCHYLKTDTIAAYRPDLDRYELRHPYMNNASSTSYPASYLTKVVWYDAPLDIIQTSKYCQDILDYREFMELKDEDKVMLPYFSELNHFILSRYGSIWKSKYLTKMNELIGAAGYKHVNFNPSYKNIDIHRLVAKYFCPIPKIYIDNGYSEKTLVVNHIDGNKLNNRWDNLEWCTNKENIQHASRTGLMATSISDEVLTRIWKLLASNYTDLEISHLVHIPPSTIGNIRQGVSLRYRTDKYTWPKSSAELHDLPCRRAHDIVADYNNGMTYAALCEKYHTTNPTILRIIKNNQHLVTRKMKDVSNRRTERLTEEQLKKIFALLKEGKIDRDVARECNISVQTVGAIRRRDKYVKESQGYTWPERGMSELAKKQEETRQKVIELYKQGLCNADIARKLGMKPGSTHGIIRRYIEKNK